MKYIEYLKLPYKFRGTGNQEGVDCYTLAKLFYQKEFGVLLPELGYQEDWFNSDSKFILQQYKKAGFKKVTTFGYGNLIVLVERNLPKHLGIIVEDGYFLHTTTAGTACHSYLVGQWANRIHTILRHKGVT